MTFLQDHLTDWQPGTTPPPRAGWYEIGFGYAKWDGFKWLRPAAHSNWSSDVRGAFRLNVGGQLIVPPMALLMEVATITQWRGITFDCGCASDEHLNLRVWYAPAAPGLAALEKAAVKKSMARNRGMPTEPRPIDQVAADIIWWLLSRGQAS